MTGPMRFFFYGTLIAGSANPAARAVHRVLRDLGPATAEGLLYAIPDPAGWYPALLPGGRVVAGRVYETLPVFAASDLARIDAWEDCDPQHPETSLYRRETLAVTGPDGTGGTALAYRFNRPLPPDACAIDGGNFHAWLEARGMKAYGDAP